MMTHEFLTHEIVKHVTQSASALFRRSHASQCVLRGADAPGDDDEPEDRGRSQGPGGVPVGPLTPRSNPYEPPRAQLERSEPTLPAPERPVQVQRAVVLLWISLIASFVGSLGEVSFLLAEEPEFGSTFIGVFVGSFALMAIPIHLVWRRRNWARYAVLLLSITGFIAAVWMPSDDASYREYMLDIVLTALEALALYLLFTGPGAAWFSRSTQGADRATA